MGEGKKEEKKKGEKEKKERGKKFPISIIY